MHDEMEDTGSTQEERDLQSKMMDNLSHKRHHRQHLHGEHRHHHTSHHHERNSKLFIHNAYESICLVFSSFLFLLPGIFALKCGAFSPGFVSVVTAIVSANYWRDAGPGIRRNLDLLVAKVSFCIYFVYGAMFVRHHLLLWIGWPICALIIFSYLLSNHHWKFFRKRWVIFHMLFHFFVAIEQLIVIIGSFEQCLPDFSANDDPSSIASY